MSVKKPWFKYQGPWLSIWIPATWQGWLATAFLAVFGAIIPQLLKNVRVDFVFFGVPVAIPIALVLWVSSMVAFFCVFALARENRL